MSELRGWHLLPEQHLHPDALVAYVDGELTPAAAARAAAHVRTCLSCNADVSAQRQARGAVRSADCPGAPAGLLASLRAIPADVELPKGPDNLAMTPEGELVSVQRTGRTAPLGASTPLGSGPAVLNTRNRFGLGRRGTQGAGMVVSGLVLGALALAAPFTVGSGAERPGVEQQKRAPVQAVRNQPGDADAKQQARNQNNADRQRDRRTPAQPAGVVRAGN